MKLKKPRFTYLRFTWPEPRGRTDHWKEGFGREILFYVFTFTWEVTRGLVSVRRTLVAAGHFGPKAHWPKASTDQYPPPSWIGAGKFIFTCLRLRGNGKHGEWP